MVRYNPQQNTWSHCSIKEIFLFLFNGIGGHGNVTGIRICGWDISLRNVQGIDGVYVSFIVIFYVVCRCTSSVFVIGPAIVRNETWIQTHFRTTLLYIIHTQIQTHKNTFRQLYWSGILLGATNEWKMVEGGNYSDFFDLVDFTSGRCPRVRSHPLNLVQVHLKKGWDITRVSTVIDETKLGVEFRFPIQMIPHRKKR